MIDPKAQIIHAILKQPGFFRVRDIEDATGQSKQLISYHLKALVSKGMLLKTGRVYSVLSRDNLLDEMVTVGDSRGLQEMQTTELIFRPKFVEFLQTSVDQIVRARILDRPESTELHVVMNREINEAIQELKTLKKWLNNKQYSETRAAAGLDETALKELEKSLCK